MLNPVEELIGEVPFPLIQSVLDIQRTRREPSGAPLSSHALLRFLLDVLGAGVARYLCHRHERAGVGGRGVGDVDVDWLGRFCCGCCW